jgi:pimeloyl-ACP methyl ester carboxylesterase
MMPMKMLAAHSADVAPSPWAVFAEAPRAAWNAGALMFAWPHLLEAPKGDGRPVMVLPGIIDSDSGNFALIALLKRLGYRTSGWELGHNFGAKTIGAGAERLVERIEALHAETGEKVTLVGISLGGIMARVMGARRPDLVREVITISSPYAGPATSTNVCWLFEMLTGEKITDASVQAFQQEAAGVLPMPSTAIWSRSDGVVNGLICHNENCRSIEVESSHCWVQLCPDVLSAVAKTLAGETAQ